MSKVLLLARDKDIKDPNFSIKFASSGFISPLAIVAALYERRFPEIAMRSAVTDRR
jgi:hypothetical protein